jgi:branched-chain amino acid transport system substrate-binding protein
MFGKLSASSVMLAVALSVGAGPAAAQSSGPIKLGVLASLTGVYAILGERTAQGVNMAVDEINAQGGILGRKLEAVIRDDETNPETSVRVTRRLVQQEGVFALFGPFHGGAAIAVTNEAQKLKIPHFPWAATEELTTTHCGRYTWRVGSNAQQTSRAGAVVAQRLGLTKWATISSDFSYGRSVVNQFTGYLKELEPKLDLAYQAWPKLGEEDLTPYISNIVRAKPEALYVGLFGADAIKFLKQAKAFGLFEQVKIFTDFGGNQTVLEALGDQAPFGHWASSRYLHNYPETAANKEFVQKFRARYNAMPDMSAGESYAAVMVLAEALRRAGSPDREKVIEALGGLAYNSPKGWIVMRPSDHQGWQSAFWGVVTKSPDHASPILSNIQVVSPIQAELPDERSGQNCRPK